MQRELSRSHTDPNKMSAVGLVTGKNLTGNHKLSGCHIDQNEDSAVNLSLGRT